MKLRFPGFKILDRYILGKFLATYFFAIAMIIVVVVLFDYVEKIDDFTELHISRHLPERGQHFHDE